MTYRIPVLGYLGHVIMGLAWVSKVGLCAQVDIAQRVKLRSGLLSRSCDAQVEKKAHTRRKVKSTWIVDEVETGESSTESVT